MRHSKNQSVRTLSKAARYEWSRRCVAAKARKRIERAESFEARLEEEIRNTKPVKMPKIEPDAIITIRIPKIGEAKTFRVHRMDDRFLALGKVQAASTIGKRIAVVLEEMT